MKKIYDYYRKNEEERIEQYGESWGFNKFYNHLEEFIEYIIEYFELNDFERDRYKFDNNLDYFSQENKNVRFIIQLLEDIKPFLLFAVKCSYISDINDNFVQSKVNEDSFVNMLDNFFRLNRTGRNRVYYEFERDRFLEFKKRFSHILDYYREIRSWGKDEKKGSILDFAKAMQKYNISNEDIRDFLIQVKIWIRDCSRATKYRFDKDLLLLEECKYYVEDLDKNKDFYLKCLKDYEK